MWLINNKIFVLKHLYCNTEKLINTINHKLITVMRIVREHVLNCHEMSQCKNLVLEKRPCFSLKIISNFFSA